MMVRAKIESLKEGRWYEHVVRFALGGAATVMTDLVAQFAGPEVGGLFLAFPAMLCASATLVTRMSDATNAKRVCGARSAAERQPRSTRQAQRLARLRSWHSRTPSMHLPCAEPEWRCGLHR